MKVGDSATVLIKLSTVYGPTLKYSSYAAFLADGWSIEATLGGVAQTLVVSSLIPDAASVASGNFDGSHLVTFTVLGAGVVTLKPVNPNKLYLSAYDVVIVAGVADTDSLAAQINSGVGAQVPGGSVSTVADLNLVEGDSAQAQYTIPASALKVFDNASKLIYSFGNLADIGGQPWTIACQARYLTENGELPTAAVAFSFQAQVLDKVNNVVGIGWLTPPAGAVIDDVLPAAPTVTVAGGLITGTTGGLGGHLYGTNVPTVALAGGGGVNGVLTPIVVNGAVTGYTVTNPGSGYGSAPTATLSVQSDGGVSARKFALDIQLVPPVGSTYAAAKLTVITGFVNLLRQQTTTP